MPVVKCDCGKQLRVADEHIGKRVKCPGCGEAVLVREPDEESAPARKTAGAAMLTFACECGKKMQARAEFAGRSVKCPECGESVKVPRGGAARDDDEDDRPARRSATTASRKTDDDRPTRGRRDDDEDDRPSRKKGKAKGKGGSAKGWLLIGGAATLLLIAGVVVMLFFMGGGASAQVGLVPGDAVGFASIRVADILNSEVGKEAVGALPQFAQAGLQESESKLGISRNDVERVTVVLCSLDAQTLGAMMGGPRRPPGQPPIVPRPGQPGGGPGAGAGALVPPTTPPDVYAIINLSKPADQKKVVDTGFAGSQVIEHNGKKFNMVVGADERAIYFHDDKTLVVGTVGGIKKAIDQAVKPKTDGPLAATLSQVNTQHVAIGGALSTGLLGMLNDAAGPQGAMAAAALGEVKSGLFTATLKGKTLEFDASATFATSARATELKTQLDEMLPALPLLAGGFLNDPKIPAEAQNAGNQVLQNLKASQSGATLTLSSKVDVPIEQFKKLLSSAGPGPGGPGGGGVGGPGGNIQETARRIQSQNNLKQMALAFHNYHSTYNKMDWAVYPPPGNPGTQPLHSWRVALLPFLEQDALYKQIRLNEPWDSQHNRQFHSRMPQVYVVPGKEAQGAQGMTYYQTFVGTGAIFEKNKQGRRLLQITDGSSNTLIVAEAARPVNWMQPDDIDFQSRPSGFTPGGRMGNHFAGGFHAAFADGSVKFIPATIPARDLQALITANGGEVVNVP